jgi:hypothetical protein
MSDLLSMSRCSYALFRKLFTNLAGKTEDHCRVRKLVKSWRWEELERMGSYDTQ